MVAWDYAEEERQKQLSNSQPLRIHWLSVLAWGSLTLLVTAWARIIWLVCRDVVYAAAMHWMN